MKLFVNYKSKTDESLMILMMNGNHQAFSELYDRYAPRLKAFFYRMLSSDSDLAEDCVHDLFTKIMERPQLFQKGRKVSPWLFTIAANMCKNHYRKKAFETTYLSQLEELVEAPKAENKLDQEQKSEQVRLILDGMDEERRTIFVLHYQQEISLEELSKMFDLPIGTIKSRLFYTRKKLASQIQ